MNEPIPVLFVVSGLAVEGPLGGVARFVIELVRTLDRTKIQPMVAALWDYNTGTDRDWQNLLLSEGIPTIIAAKWDERHPYLSCLRALHGMYSSDLPQVRILHSHGEFSDVAAWVLKRRFGAQALVRTVHNEIEWAKRPVLGKIFGGCIFPFVFDAEWGVSKAVVSRLDARPLARLRKRRSFLMYNALNFQRFQPVWAVDRHAIRAQLGIPNNAKVIGTVGRLVPQKGHTFLLQAMALLVKRFPNLHLVIVGTGPLEETLKSEAYTLGIDHRVHWLGPRPDVEKLLTAFDLFVLSSLWEGLSTVIMESLATGVPVVATRVSGTAELLDGGMFGILVEPADARALAEGIEQAFHNLDTLRSSVQRARPVLEARFSIKRIAAQHVQAYQELVSAKGLRATRR